MDVFFLSDNLILWLHFYSSKYILKTLYVKLEFVTSVHNFKNIRVHSNSNHRDHAFILLHSGRSLVT